MANPSPIRVPCPNHDSVAWCARCGGPDGDRTVPAAVLCDGCGFYVEQHDVIEWHDTLSAAPPTNCAMCRDCQAFPKLKESYRRGFNLGLDTLASAVTDMVQKTNLRKRPLGTE